MKDRFLKFNKYITKYIYKNKLMYPLIFIVSLIIPVIILLGKCELINESNYIKFLLSLLIFVDIDLIILNIINREYKVEDIFLSLILPLGLAMSILVLPNFVPDEAAHSYRVYVISRGHILTDKNKNNSPKMIVPNDLIDTLTDVNTYKQLGESLKKDTNYKKRSQVSQDGVGASTYFFVGYLFPAITMRIGEALDINILLVYYIARISSLLMFSVIIYLAIKLIPFGKWVLLIYCLNPMYIQQSASLNADTLINSLSILLIGYTMYKLKDDKDIRRKDIVLLCIITFLLSMLKYAYFPLSLCILLLINKKNSKKINIELLLIVISSILLAFVMYFFTIKYYTLMINYLIINGVDSAKQLSFIMHNPLSYINVLIKTTVEMSGFYMFTMFGRNLGRFTIIIDEIFPIIYFVIFILSAFIDKSKYELKAKDIIIFALIVIGAYGVVETGLYLGWTRIGAELIEGVQGRYFIPILFLVPLALIRKSNYIYYKYNKVFFVLVSVSINIYSISKIITFFNY